MYTKYDETINTHILYNYKGHKVQTKKLEHGSNKATKKDPYVTLSRAGDSSYQFSLMIMKTMSQAEVIIQVYEMIIKN
jgi:biopolymer transport protein ExbD